MQEHGSFEIEVTGQTIRVKLFDQWNYETTVRFCNEFKVIALTISDKPWACLVDLLDWELGTPDIWAPLEGGNLWSSNNNQKYEASVSKLGVHKHVMKKSDEALIGVQTNAFDNVTDALAWLEEVGIRTTNLND
mgnify:CR=1 FL=1